MYPLRIGAGVTLSTTPSRMGSGDLFSLPTIDNASYQTRCVGVNDRNFPTVCRVASKTAMIPGAQPSLAMRASLRPRLW